MANTLGENYYSDSVSINGTSGGKSVQIRSDRQGKVKFVTFINPTPYEIYIFRPETTQVEAIAQKTGYIYSIGKNGNLTLPLVNGIETGFLLTWQNVAPPSYSLNVTLLFTEINLNHNSANASGFTGGGNNVSIVGDSVGLAKEIQLPPTLDFGNLRVALEVDNIGLPLGEQLPTTLNVDGSLKVGTIQLPSTLQTDGYLKTACAGRSLAIAGKITVATTGTPITGGNVPCGDGLTFIADPTNTGNVFIFPIAGSKNDVVPLSAGQSLFLPINNLNLIKVDSSVNSQSVYWNGAV